jgi:hypothetical protein
MRIVRSATRCRCRSRARWPTRSIRRAPEEALARREHAELLARALRETIAAQPSRTRAVLRYYYGDRIGNDEIGAIYHVHASTVSSWLASARDAILAGTRKPLASEVGIAASEVDQLLGVTTSPEVRLQTLLATKPTYGCCASHARCARPPSPSLDIKRRKRATGRVTTTCSAAADPAGDDRGPAAGRALRADAA